MKYGIIVQVKNKYVRLTMSVVSAAVVELVTPARGSVCKRGY